MFKGFGLQSAAGCPEALGPTQTHPQTMIVSKVCFFTALSDSTVLRLTACANRRAIAGPAFVRGFRRWTIALEPVPYKTKNR